VASVASGCSAIQPCEPPVALHFSVVISVYNGARFLEAALDSVSKQTLQDWTCVLVDDGSDDGSYELACRWAAAQKNRVQVLTHSGHTRRGVVESRNRGIGASAAPWIAFLDQDDVWHASKLERQAAFITQQPNLAAVGCVPEVQFDGVEPWPYAQAWAQMIGSIDARRARNLQLRDFIAICPFCLSGVVARREALLEAGGFDARLPRTSDWLMWALLASKGPLGLVRESLVVYRVHGGNEILKLAEDPVGAARGMFEMHERMAEHLARDRAQSREEAAAWIQRLFLETAEVWYAAATGVPPGHRQRGAKRRER
jgi:glycosyltransferase involved in cell wall biosynthesis